MNLLKLLQEVLISFGIVTLQWNSLNGAVHFLSALYYGRTAAKQLNIVPDLYLLNFKGEAIKTQPFPFAMMFQMDIKRKLYLP